MTRIRANCPDCGDVELTPDEILIQVAHDDAELVGDGSQYRFTCPDCAGTVTKPADDRIVQLLITGGVALEVAAPSSVPPPDLRPDHPEHPPAGAPLTMDDLLDLHLLLESDDWFGIVAAPHP
jgi:predicted RNA-binding Zn-ribbon protein involved in translation (DUF1610 family)